MEFLLEISKYQYGEWQLACRTNISNLVVSALILIVLIKLIKGVSSILGSIIRFLIGIFFPINYELDMTTEVFCKNILEVNNKLAKQLTARNEFDKTRSGPLSGALDCTTDLPNGIQTEHNKQDSTTVNGNVQGDVHGELHVYPNGWLPLMESFKVKAGSIERAIIMGRDLIVTRSTEGEVHVLDAYCPHIGVHIGVGGRVVRINDQSCVQCPFHGWTFRASDGQCVHIPYLKNPSKSCIPKQARLALWESVEIDNFIYIWHHIDNQPPNWSFIQTKELLSKSWTFAGRSCHISNLDIRDMLENGADLNHFEGIHNDLFFFGGNFLKIQAYKHFQNYFRHHWSPNWNPILDEEGRVTHMAEMDLLSWISFFNTRIFDIHVHATQIGPACVKINYDSEWYGKGILTMNAIPLGGRRTMYIQHIYTEFSLKNWFMARWVLYGEVQQLERDFFIWNHKKNIKNPIFVPEDKILKRFRLWYSQFYKRKRHIKITNCSDQPIENKQKDF